MGFVRDDPVQANLFGRPSSIIVQDRDTLDKMKFANQLWKDSIILKNKATSTCGSVLVKSSTIRKL